MYYERTETGWKPNNKKSVLFKKSTYPVEIVPVEFWNADRMPDTPVPVDIPDTHKLVGPQEIGDETVGYITAEKTPEELFVELQAKRSMMIVTPWQFLKALNIKGLRVAVEYLVSQADQDTQDGFHRASSFERLDPLVAVVGGALGKSDEYIDELFEMAGTL